MAVHIECAVAECGRCRRREPPILMTARVVQKKIQEHGAYILDEYPAINTFFHMVRTPLKIPGSGSIAN